MHRTEVKHEILKINFSILVRKIISNSFLQEAESALKIYRNARRTSQIETEYFQHELKKLQCVVQPEKSEKTIQTKLSLADFSKIYFAIKIEV